MGSELPAFCFSSDSHCPGGDKRQERGLFSGLGHTLGSSPTSCHAKVSFLELSGGRGQSQTGRTGKQVGSRGEGLTAAPPPLVPQASW